MTKHLKNKTDAECRVLAGHYYARARIAEKARDEAEKRVTALLAENLRLIGLASEMIEPTREALKAQEGGR